MTTFTNNIASVHAAQSVRPGYLTAKISGNTVSGVINRGANVYVRQNGKLIKTIASGSKDYFNYTLPNVSSNTKITISSWKPGYSRREVNLIQAIPNAYLSTWLTDNNTLHAITNTGATVYIHQNGRSIYKIVEQSNQSGFSYSLPITSTPRPLIEVISIKNGHATAVNSLQQAATHINYLANDAANFKKALRLLPDSIYGKPYNPNSDYDTSSASKLAADFNSVMHYVNVDSELFLLELPSINQLTAYYKNRLNAEDFAQMQKLVSLVKSQTIIAEDFWYQYIGITKKLIIPND